MSLFRLRNILTLSVLLLCMTVDAQVIDSSLYQGGKRTAITPYMQVFTSEQQLPVDSIVLPQFQARFVPTSGKAVNFSGYDPFYYWFRMVVNNSDPVEKDLLLLMGPIGMREGKLYRVRNGSWNLVSANGLKYPFRERPYPYAHYVFPLQLTRHTTDTFYLSVDATHSYRSYGFALLEPTTLKVFENRLYLLFGLILGILLLFLIFNLYLYYSLKDKIHIWYSLYLLFMILVVMKNDQLDQQFLGWDNETLNRLTPIQGLGAVAIGVLMHVVQQFLVNIPVKSIIYRLSTLTKVNALVSGVAHAVVFNIKPDYITETAFFRWANISTSLTIVLIITSCMYSLAKGFKSALFILIGLLVFLIGALQRLTLASTLSYLFPPSTFHVGMVIETFIISFGLMYRYRVERKEKLLYQKEKETLENNFDKLLLESKFEIQEQTLKNIAGEIHDNIGQILSIVRMNLAQKATQQHGVMKESLDESIQLIGKAIKDLRDLSKMLDADYVLEMGLLKSISYELEQIRRFGDYETELVIEGDALSIAPQKELILFRMYQEILNNIIKHARATAIKVEVSCQPQLLRLTISDNGVGFNVSAGSNSFNGQGLGIKNMYRRADLLGAAFRISSGSDGTRVVIELPL